MIAAAVGRQLGNLAIRLLDRLLIAAVLLGVAWYATAGRSCTAGMPFDAVLGPMRNNLEAIGQALR